jgi:TRAP-type mannitol/chloroaromatic compound transport system permease small subunit
MLELLLAYQRWADRFAEVTGKVSQWIVIPTVVIRARSDP